MGDQNQKKFVCLGSVEIVKNELGGFEVPRGWGLGRGHGGMPPFQRGLGVYTPGNFILHCIVKSVHFSAISR